jgi:uncharacterized protein
LYGPSGPSLLPVTRRCRSPTDNLRALTNIVYPCQTCSFAPKKLESEKIEIAQQTLWLTPKKAIYWEEAQSLIVSDCHFGKTGHFRKSGIAVPQAVYKEDLQQLVYLLQFFKPVELIVVGDLFHSHANKELDWFLKWRNDFEALAITLVKGNHDILDDAWYRDMNIDVRHGVYAKDPFSFCHDVADICVTEQSPFLFTGHFHPGVTLRGAGKQSLHFPCYYFTAGQCILPAFGNFNGTATVVPGRNNRVFAIAGNQIIKL